MALLTFSQRICFPPQWSTLPVGFELKNVDLEVARGELVAVVGLVGSGKSMLIQSILRETNRVSGTYVRGFSFSKCSLLVVGW